MRTRTCMCGAKVSKSREWDEDLDQCSKCTRTGIERGRMYEYLEQFEIGDLFDNLGIICVLLDKTFTDTGELRMWRIHEVQTGRTRNLWVAGWLVQGGIRTLRENIRPINGEGDEC